ncbi:MAG: PIN/TRAM domain-containing protein [Anaerolineales bacterium]
MGTEIIFRLLGMVIFGLGGGYMGWYFGMLQPSKFDFYISIFGLGGALLGLILTPYFTIYPVRAFRTMLTRLPAETLFAGILGLMIGLLIAVLLAFPLSLLPAPLGRVMPFVGAVLFGYLGIALFVMRQGDLLSLLSALSGRGAEAGSSSWNNLNRTILVDTSTIIDGRIADIVRTGFLPGTLLVPRFVLNELQYIADSADSLRRQRGRRGMEVLAELQKMPNVLVRISDIDVEGVREVDSKLVILARQLKAPILTNDYNLNRIAELQGVIVLNINELANAVRSVVLPGETLTINIIQEGKEPGQGVGYMDDGTMIVIENGKEYIGEYTQVVVTKVLQTAAGRMIFARVEEEKKPRR